MVYEGAVVSEVVLPQASLLEEGSTTHAMASSVFQELAVSHHSSTAREKVTAHQKVATKLCHPALLSSVPAAPEYVGL
jgi:hypothetical protein